MYRVQKGPTNLYPPASLIPAASRSPVQDFSRFAVLRRDRRMRRTPREDVDCCGAGILEIGSVVW